MSEAVDMTTKMTTKMAPSPLLRVIEIRACENGFVVTSFEREGRYDQARDRMVLAWPFATHVANKLDDLQALVRQLASDAQWDKRAIEIPPARPDGA